MYHHADVGRWRGKPAFLRDGPFHIVYACLPSRFKLTVRGRGRRQHLDLELEPDQWGTLLYT